jgi:hypothetical protein
MRIGRKISDLLRMNNHFDDPQPAAVVNEVALHIAPFLKEKGFKKSARVWYKEGADVGYLIDIQSSKWNRRGEDVEFAVNYGVFVPLTYEASYYVPPPKKPTGFSCVLHHRLTKSGRGDYWWKLHGKQDIDTASGEVLALLKQHALPFFDSIRDIPTIAKSLAATHHASDLRIAAISWAELGDSVKAKKLFEETISKSSQNPAFQKNVKALAMKRYGIKL